MANNTQAVSANNTVYAKSLLFFWESGILVYARQRLPIWPAPNKNRDCWVPNDITWLTTFHMCYHNVWGVKHILCDSIGVESLETWVCFPLNAVPCTSSVSWFAFYPFALTKHSSKTICQVLWVLLMNHQIHGGSLVYPQHNYTAEYPHDLNVRKDFLRTQRRLPIKERINTFDYIKIKNFCSRYHKENAKASHGMGKDV